MMDGRQEIFKTSDQIHHMRPMGTGTRVGGGSACQARARRTVGITVPVRPAPAGLVPAEAIVTGSGLDLGGLLRPVREGLAFEETVERLLTLIKLRLVGPGERFPAERELAVQLGISRLTLREALGELARAGYVESRRGRSGGTFVTGTPPAPDRGELRRLAQDDEGKLADALTFRQAVETGAAEALAQLVAQSAARPDTTQALLARLAGGNAPGPPDY